MQSAVNPRWMLALALACAAGAAALAAGPADRALFLAINGAGAVLPDGVASGLTVLGHGLVAVMLVALLLPRAPWILAAALYATPIAALFSWGGKRLAATPRPAAVLDPALLHVQGMVLRGSNSFPSGHSITAFLVATVVVLGLPAGRWRWAGIALALALAFLVALSRVLVGAHWPSDTLAGAALGILAGVAGTAAARRVSWWQGRRAGIVLALVVLACAAALVEAQTGYPAGEPVQWLTAAAGAIAAAIALRRTLARP